MKPVGTHANEELVFGSATFVMVSGGGAQTHAKSYTSSPRAALFATRDEQSRCTHLPAVDPEDCRHFALLRRAALPCFSDRRLRWMLLAVLPVLRVTTSSRVNVWMSVAVDPERPTQGKSMDSAVPDAETMPSQLLREKTCTAARFTKSWVALETAV